MRLEDYHALYEILGELRQEAATLEVQITYSFKHVREADAYLKTFENHESEDVRVFSPKKMDTLHKEEMKRIQEEKYIYEKQNRELRDRKAVLDGRIRKLSDVIHHHEQDDSTRKDGLERLHGTIAKNLGELALRVETSSAQIEKKPFQARQDFAIIAKCLRDTADKIKNMTE